MDFQQQKIFENEAINQICDFIFNKVNEKFGRTTDIVICGSVGKILSEVISEDYEAKDLDFVVRDYLVWKFLVENLLKWFPDYRTEVIGLERVILFTDLIAIEFWAGNRDIRSTKNITNNVKYISYGNKI